MLLAELAATSQRVTATGRRLEKIGAVATCAKQLLPEEIEIGVLFLSGEVRQRKLGVGYALLRDASDATAATLPSLNLLDVDAALASIAQAAGPGSAARRKETLARLLARATSEEQNFLARLFIGELRQGALEAVMVEAVARAADVPVADVRRATMLAGGVAPVARAALVEGAAGLKRFSVTLFQPIQPMLAQPIEDITNALQQFGTAAFEWKLDGVRVQVHKEGEVVRVYTRSLNDITSAVPEIVAATKLPVAKINSPR